MLSERKGNNLIIFDLESEFCSDDERELQSVDTIVVHTMYSPESKNPYNILRCLELLDEYEVSSHYLISRRGTVCRLVPENKRAWHAGTSQMPMPDGRSNVNTFSVGIELVANETDGLTNNQYESLANLVANITSRLPITSIVGHKDIAPERKTDPWNLDWNRFRADLKEVVDTNRFKMIGPSNSD